MSTPQPSSGQAKISRKLVARTAGLLFVLAGLFGGFRYYQSLHGDFNQFGDADTVGLIAALQSKPNGTEAVVFGKDGKPKGTSSWTERNTDRDLTWRPDGRFVFFVSDRLQSTFHVYRWAPSNADAEARTVGTRGRSNPTFPPAGTPDANDSMLIVSGGNVLAFDPVKRATPQILPPVGAEIAVSSEEEGGGSEGQFSAIYGNLGTSFRVARWCKGKQYIAAIMRRDSGEVLILQDMKPDDKGKFKRPMPIVAGDRIDFDVNPKDGSIVYCVQGFRFPDPKLIPPQFIKNGKVTLPFHHVVGIVDPDQAGQGPIVASADDKVAFGAPSISPDGSMVLLTSGSYADGSLTPGGLATMPCRAGGGSVGSLLSKGEIYEPSWSGDGNQVIFAQRQNGHRDIMTIKKDGTELKNLTNGSGDFFYPKFSPMVAKQSATAQ